MVAASLVNCGCLVAWFMIRFVAQPESYSWLNQHSEDWTLNDTLP